MPITPSKYTDKDDGIHLYKTPDYYEWWYNDAHFDNGYSCVTVFHWMCGFNQPRIPVVTKEIYTPEGEKISGARLCQPSDCTASASKCDVKMGDCWERQEGDSYRIYAPGKKTGMDLTFKRIVPPWKPLGIGRLYDNHDQVQGWLVPCPRAEVEGTITLRGKEIKVKGKGYHDHNWGNVSMHDSLGYWWWGRFHHPEYTLIYYYLYPTRKNEPNIPRLFLAKGDKVLMTPENVQLKASEPKLDKETGQMIPRKLDITAKDGNSSVKLEVITKSIFDTNTIPTMAPWPAYYWRFKADYKCTIKVGNKVDEISGNTMSEYELLRPQAVAKLFKK